MEPIYEEWLREIFDIIQATGYSLYTQYDEYKDKELLKEYFYKGESSSNIAEILVMKFEDLDIE